MQDREVIIQVKYTIMQNSISLPPKDQGELVMPSGTNRSGKVLQNKSQFRTIAPKIMPKVLTSRVLSCPSPSLSDQVNPGLSGSSTPLEVPAQNYALMQVAGQEGTFSLVALPHVASAQPIQKPRLPLPENLKLPIPRYQRPRNNKGVRKKHALSSSESGCSKPIVQTQTSPSPRDHPEVPAQPSPAKPALSLDQVPASVRMAALTSGAGHGDSQPPVTNVHGDSHLPNAPTASTPEEPAAKQGLVKILGKENFANRDTSSKPSAVVTEKHKEQVDLVKGMIRLTPAIFGNALQLIPSVPKGKLPILPYSRVKTTEVYKRESDANAADSASPGLRASCNKTSSTTEGSDAATKMASKVPGPQVSKPSSCPATKLDLNHKTKRNGGATKKKGRKPKVPDEILAFQGKRRKSKRIKNNSQEPRDQKPEAMKKYRSIMPKPVTATPALAPLASPAAMFQSQRPSSLGQDALIPVNHSLTPKYLGCKQDGSPSPKPSSAFRNGHPDIQKPWHRCPVCNHHFQFKQHLRDHMNTHTNRRPYSCRICRKAYVRSGSLSSHMKLHHGENRLKKLMCCEFCAKVFGHVRVYFGHLKEVHRVVISTEPSPSELQPGDLPKDRDREVTVRAMEGPVHRENKSSPEEDLLLNQADEVKLQIKCGRCQITAQSFAEIKFHLLYVHGEEIQGRLQEEVCPGRPAVPGELFKKATPSWKPRPEKERLLNHCPSDEEGRAFPKLKGQLYLHHRDAGEILTKPEGVQPGPREPEGAWQSPARPGPHSVLLGSPSGLNCVLCAQTLGRKEELLLHWERQHSCEDPPRLWKILNALPNPGGTELPGEPKM